MRLVWLLLLWPCLALAQDDAKARADEMVAQRRYREALELYDVAYAASPNAAILFNKARVHHLLGELPQALANLERFDAEAPPDLRAKVPGLQTFLAEVRAKVATVVVKCNVDGARVTIADRAAGATPLAPIRLNAGKGTIDVIAEGYHAYSRPIEYPGGATLVLDVTLIHKDRSVLTVKSNISGTTAYVDGRRLGATPGETPVAPGAHTVRVERSGFDPRETTVNVFAGEKKEVLVDPLERPSVTSRWWFWTGAAVLLVGGVVIGVVAASERPRDTGDFSPGSVSAPLVRF
jgi:hypothetical protein